MVPSACDSQVEVIELVGGDVLEPPGEFGELPVALDPAELVLGAGHPGGCPAQRHLAVTPALHVGRMVADVLWSPGVR